MSTELIQKTMKRRDFAVIDWENEFNALGESPQEEEILILTVRRVAKEDIDVDGSIMPPESQISDKLIQAVKASEESYKKGNFTSFDDTDDLFEHLDNL